MGTIFIPEDDEYYSAVGSDSREVLRTFKNAQHVGTLFIQVAGKSVDSPFTVGQKIYLKTPNYDISGTIWYIYNGTSGGRPVFNLYVKAPYNGDDFSGSVSTSPIIEIPSADILTTNIQKVSTAIDGGKGTGAPIIEGAAKAVSSPKNWLFIGIAAALGFIAWKRFGKKGKK